MPNELETTIRTIYESQIKATIKWWEDFMVRMVRECLPEEHIELENQDEQSKLMSIGHNACRFQIIANFEKKFGIKI